MHQRNPFKEHPPNFKQLARKYPEFRQYCSIVAGGKVVLNFANADAVRQLAKVLLLDYFGLDVDLPEGALVPRVPQRMNYVLLIEDLLQANGLEDYGSQIVGIDIGTGPSCIYPLLGAKRNGWCFYASDTDPHTIATAIENVGKNSLASKIHLVQPRDPEDIFQSIMTAAENEGKFSFCMCNPPFFDPEECAEKFHPVENRPGHLSNAVLVMSECSGGETAPHSATLARSHEVATLGGEVDFVRSIIQGSLLFKDRIRIFTTMIGKKASWQPICRTLDELGANKSARKQLYSLSQGRTHRWVVAWTFDPAITLNSSLNS